MLRCSLAMVLALGLAPFCRAEGRDALLYPTPPGADPTGSTDSTPAVQAALDQGGNVLYFPPGTYRLCGVEIPNTPRLHIFGAGAASRIIQGKCRSPVFRWATASIAYSAQTISDLNFDGTLGQDHTIDTSGTGGLTLRQLSFWNVPAGHDNVHIDGAAGMKEHDTRLIDLQFYSDAKGPRGHAMIGLGSGAADGSIVDTIGNGAFVVDHGLTMAAGNTTQVLTGNHFYNVGIHVLGIEGCSNCQFANNTWDNAQGDVAVITATNSVFSNEHYEAAHWARNALTLVNARANIWQATIWGTQGQGAGYAVQEIGTSDGNIFIGGVINTLRDWAVPIFQFGGLQSYAVHVPGFSAPPAGVGAP